MRRTLRAGLTALAVVVGALATGTLGRGRVAAEDHAPPAPGEPSPRGGAADAAVPAGASAAVPAGPAAPAPLSPARTVRNWAPDASAVPSVLLVGDASGHAIDVLGPLEVGAIEVALASEFDERAVLVVGREEALRPMRAALRDFVRSGGVVFVDAWKGDEAWLASLAEGGTVRALTADDAILSTPSPLGALPPSHSDPDPTLVGVVAGDEVRVVATRQDTLCHDCSCERAAGRAAFGGNLAEHATRVAKRSRAAEAPAADAGEPFAFGDASIEGRRLRASVFVRNESREDSVAWLRLVSREGAIVAAASRPLPAGGSADVSIDCELRPPFDVVEHRLVASRETAATVLRAVASLESCVGAPDLVVWHTGAFVPGMAAAVRAVVRNSRTLRPIDRGELRAAFVTPAGEPVAASRGAMDAAGTAPLAVDVPASAAGRMIWNVEAATPLGAERISTRTEASPAVAGHFFADVPVHRPGSTLRFRLLVVRRPSNAAAAGVAADVALVGPVESAGRFTTVGETRITTDARGVCVGEIAIPPATATGDYELRAAGLAAGRIRIESFETPRFRVAFDPAPRVLRPSAPLAGTVVAERFDGTPIAGAVVSVVLGTDGFGDPALARWEGVTDAAGRAGFRLEPAGPQVRRGAVLRLDASVRDAGGRTVTEVVQVVVATVRETGTAQVFAPAGALLAGRPGSVLVRSGALPGAAVTVRAAGGPPQRLIADDRGFVEADVPAAAGPVELDVDGVPVRRERSGRRVALRPARRVVAAGSLLPVRVEVLGADDAVFVDVVALGTLVAAHRLRVVGGVAAADLPLPDGLTGPVTIQAWVPSDGRVPDPAAAAIVIVPPETLRVSVTPSAHAVRPGEPVELSVRVTDPAGRGVASAFALRVVDEAVLSLVEQPIDVAHVTLALRAALSLVRDGDDGPSLASLVAAAGRRPLSRGESRLADVLVAAGDAAVGYPSVARSLPARREESLDRATAQWNAFAAEFRARAVEALTGPHSPVPSPECADVASAIRDMAARGVFGPDGLLDPWGSPLALGPAPAFGLSFVADASAPESERATPSGGGLVLESPGPDGRTARRRVQRSTSAGDAADDDVVPFDHDDQGWAYGERETLEMHAAWVRVHGAAFDTDGYARTIGIGGGAGGAFGGRRGGHRSLRAGGGGRATRPLEDPPTPRARSIFPDAIVFAPLVVTDDEGRAAVTVATPDSVTTWRADAVAHAASGGVGQGDAQFRTVLPFVADLDVPPTLHAGDEVAIPVLLRWNGVARGTVLAAVAVSGPLALLSPAQMAAQPGAAGETVMFVRVRATGPGVAKLTVRCTSGAASDAVERGISVSAAGREVAATVPVRSPTGRAAAELPRNERAIPGSERLELRLRGGALDDVLDGVAGLLRQPRGCFEQVSSTTYPNILATLALDGTAEMTSDVREGFDRAIRDGTRLLLSYEIPGGGFDWFGRPPAKLLLSAYGAQEFWALHELRRRRGIEWDDADSGALAVALRTTRWLLGKQREDGSFPAEGAPYEWRGEASGELAATAYVGIALSQAARRAPGTEFADALRRTRAWVASRSEACDDPYALALTAYFLAETGPDAASDAAARRLAAKVERSGGIARVGGGRGSAFHGRGDVAAVEATALAALAASRRPGSAVLPHEDLLQGLAAARCADGTWGTTHATVLALQAFLEQREGRMAPGTDVVVRPAGAAERAVRAPATPGAVTLDLGDALLTKGPRRVEVVRPDGGAVAGALTLTCSVPWAPTGDGRGAVVAERSFPATARVGERFVVPVTVRNRGAVPVAMPVVVVPLPAGVAADEAALRAAGLPAAVERVECDAERVAIYLRELAPGATVACAIPATARLRGTVRVAPATARPYYEPDAETRSAPSVLTVEE